MKRLCLFLLFLFPAYLLLCFLTPGLLITGKAPGDPGYSLERFKDIKNYKNIDLLFLGSSHCYRAFDNRIFENAGFKAFNLGSTAQTPLNSYYLLREYFDRLKPKVVIFEVYYGVCNLDGLESFMDIVVNHDLTGNIILMGLETRNIRALNALFSEWAKRKLFCLEKRQQRQSPHNTYISGGYVETDLINEEKGTDSGLYAVKMNSSQIEFLKKIIRFVQARGSRIILVTQPLPKYILNNLAGYTQASRAFQLIAEANNARFIDFNYLVSLDDCQDFRDSDHLNANGVKKFNDKLIQTLKTEGSLR